jgi:hypothetical protein
MLGLIQDCLGYVALVIGLLVIIGWIIYKED